MDKLESIKNKLRGMDEECELSEGFCNICTYKYKCFEMFGSYSSPNNVLKMIENIEKELND